MADLTDQIVDAAGKPFSVSKGDASITRHRLKDLAEAQRVLREGSADELAEAAALPHMGLRFSQLKPGGCG